MTAEPSEPGLDPYRRVLVDGLNALGSRPDGWWRDRPAAMAALVRALEGFAAEAGLDVQVVFDGRPHEAVGEAAERVRVRFAGRGANAADKEIAALVRADPEPAAVLVVSSDRRLGAAVKAAGGACTGSGGFVRRWL